MIPFDFDSTQTNLPYRGSTGDWNGSSVAVRFTSEYGSKVFAFLLVLSASQSFEKIVLMTKSLGERKCCASFEPAKVVKGT
jgi:CRISPR/Cas system-associated protein Cas5 (RAMP superfamily)